MHKNRLNDYVLYKYMKKNDAINDACRNTPYERYVNVLTNDCR